MQNSQMRLRYQASCFIIGGNDRDFVYSRSVGGFPVEKRQKEMRAQRLLNARQPANEHRRVLCAVICHVLINRIGSPQFV